jgi:hypothetical protein
MTWAISWLALNDTRQEYKDARRLLASYHDRYGDEVTFIPGGYFAPMYDTRVHIRVTIHKALQLISEMVGHGYRPQCLVAGFGGCENQRFLATEAFMSARARYGAVAASTMVMATASAIRTIPVASTT